MDVNGGPCAAVPAAPRPLVWVNARRNPRRVSTLAKSAPVSSLFDRVVSVLFGAARPPGDVDQQLVLDTIDAVVETVEPRVRLRSGYRDKLDASVRRTLAHLRELAAQLPRDPLLLSRAAWSQDPHVRTFFANADDVATCIGHCDELRGFFDGHSECDEAVALLGMQRRERQVLAPRLEGEVLRQDVAQTTVSFSAHRLLAPAADLAQSRLAVGRRILERLAQLTLARVVQINQEAQDLHQRKALLATRLRMLRAARDGMQPLVDAGLPIEQQILAAERAMKETADDHAEARSSLGTLDDYIGHIQAVLGEPHRHVALDGVALRVNRMGVKVDAGSAEEADDLSLAELSIGDGLRAAIVFVRIPRSELPPRQDTLAQALRTL